MKTISSIKSLLAAGLIFGTAFVAQAQSILAEGKKHISYTFQQGGGTNACAVVYVPSMSAYVAAIAGNSEFPLEFFSLKGEPISQHSTGLDIRGMWFAKNTLMANAAGEEGWFKISPDDLKNAGQWSLVRDGQNQPDFQSVLAFTGKGAVGYYDGTLYFYSKKGSAKKEIQLSGYSGNVSDLNGTTVGYTGDSKFPLALLNWADYKVELFSMSGEYLGGCRLPVEGNPGLDMFRFSVANKMAWVYDIEDRTWTSYRIIQ